MFGLFKKKSEDFLPVLKGKVVSIEEVPDVVFSQKMLGDGFAIEPENGIVVAPVDGVIAQIFPTNHAFGIITDSGLEILVHIGIDTVDLKGQGFERFVEVDQKVKAGTPIIKFDLAFVRANAKSVMTPVVVTNKEKVKSMHVNYGVNPEVAATVEINN